MSRALKSLAFLMVFTLVSCGVKTASPSLGSSGTVSIPSGNNIMKIGVNDSTFCEKTNENGYINKPCVKVTICRPGTSTCITINDIVLDTGSYGLRVFRSSNTSNNHYSNLD